MKHGRRKGSISWRWEWLRTRCSRPWVEFWVEVLGSIPGKPFEWWAWVDLNHRLRPYRGSVVRLYNNIQDRGDCQTPRKSYKTSLSVGWVVG